MDVTVFTELDQTYTLSLLLTLKDFLSVKTAYLNPWALVLTDSQRWFSFLELSDFSK